MDYSSYKQQSPLCSQEQLSIEEPIYALFDIIEFMSCHDNFVLDKELIMAYIYCGL